ncbi:MAG: flagellar rod-binding protein FlgJ [Pseudomonadota bacterium]|jgi:Rod binding domain-containing protein
MTAIKSANANAITTGNAPAQAIAPKTATGVAKGESVSPKDIARVKQSAQEFEAIFLEMMLKTMRDSVQKSGLIDGGNAEQMYQSMLDSEYAKQMSAQNMTGIAGNIESQLLSSMGVKTDAAALRAAKFQGLAGYQAVSKGKIP